MQKIGEVRNKTSVPVFFRVKIMGTRSSALVI